MDDLCSPRLRITFGSETYVQVHSACATIACEEVADACIASGLAGKCIKSRRACAPRFGIVASRLPPVWLARDLRGAAILIQFDAPEAPLLLFPQNRGE